MSRYAGKKTGKKIADEETAQKIIAALENESIKYETYFKLIIFFNWGWSYFTKDTSLRIITQINYKKEQIIDPKKEMQ